MSSSCQERDHCYHDLHLHRAKSLTSHTTNSGHIHSLIYSFSLSHLRSHSFASPGNLDIVRSSGCLKLLARLCRWAIEVLSKAVVVWYWSTVLPCMNHRWMRLYVALSGALCHQFSITVPLRRTVFYTLLHLIFARLIYPDPHQQDRSSILRG